MTEKQLRYAVATDGPIVRWQARCVESLAAVPTVSIERWLVVALATEARKTAAGIRALAPTDVPDALDGLTPEELDLSTDPTPPAASGVTVDVLVDLSTVGLDLPVPWASEVWRFGYGRALSSDPARSALIEYARGTGSTRVALVSRPSGEIVREGLLQTVSWWTGMPLDRLLLDTADWPALVARARADPGGPEPTESTRADGAPEPTDGQPKHAVAPQTRRDGADRLGKPLLEVAAAGRRMRGWVDVLARHVDWNIGIVESRIDRLLAGEQGLSVTWLPLRPGRFSADPFGIERDGILHILFEDFDQRRGRASIAHLAVDRNGVVSEPTIVLDPGVHASYPYLIEHDGGIFMLPETSAAGELVLYEAVDFPQGWRPIATMLPGIAAVDASVIEHAGRWWMFATRADRGANQNLFVWHAPGLMGPWTPHAANPVKTDARSARPGGTPFVHEGRLYRPSQDNSTRYGGRISLNRVDVLTPTAFSERRVRMIGPWPGSRYRDGLHTLSAVVDRTLIDGNRLHFVGDVLRFNLDGKVPGRRSS